MPEYKAMENWDEDGSIAIISPDERKRGVLHVIALFYEETRAHEYLNFLTGRNTHLLETTQPIADCFVEESGLPSQEEREEHAHSSTQRAPVSFDEGGGLEEERVVPIKKALPLVQSGEISKQQTTVLRHLLHHMNPATHLVRDMSQARIAKDLHISPGSAFYALRELNQKKVIKMVEAGTATKATVWEVLKKVTEEEQAAA